MMLWCKAWWESRARFVISAAALAGFCLFTVLFQSQMRAHQGLLPGFRSVTYSDYIYKFIYAGTAKGLFVVFILPFLGAGGVLRERAYGTAHFTLALPVSRWRLVATPGGVGLLELAVLALLPAFLIPSLSPLVHQSYPFAQAVHFSVLWFSCGTIIFATTFILSALVGGEFTAPMACIILLFLQDPVVLHLAPSWKIVWIMGEFRGMHWDAQRHLLVSGPLPWVRLLVLMLIAFSLLALAIRVTQRKDF